MAVLTDCDSNAPNSDTHTRVQRGLKNCQVIPCPEHSSLATTECGGHQLSLPQTLFRAAHTHLYRAQSLPPSSMAPTKCGGHQLSPPEKSKDTARGQALHTHNTIKRSGGILVNVIFRFCHVLSTYFDQLISLLSYLFR